MPQFGLGWLVWPGATHVIWLLHGHGMVQGDLTPISGRRLGLSAKVAQLSSVWSVQEDIAGVPHYSSSDLRQQAPQVSACVIFADILLAQASLMPEGTIPGGGSHRGREDSNPPHAVLGWGSDKGQRVSTSSGPGALCRSRFPISSVVTASLMPPGSGGTEYIGCRGEKGCRTTYELPEFGLAVRGNPTTLIFSLHNSKPCSKRHTVQHRDWPWWLLASEGGASRDPLAWFHVSSCILQPLPKRRTDVRSRYLSRS